MVEKILASALLATLEECIHAKYGSVQLLRYRGVARLARLFTLTLLKEEGQKCFFLLLLFFLGIQYRARIDANRRVIRRFHCWQCCNYTKFSLSILS